MDSITQVAQEMRTVLSEEAAQIGRETGFVQRRSKLGGAEFTQTLVFGWLQNPQATLEELAQTAASLEVSISPQGLDHRFTSAGAECLKGVLAAAVRRAICASNPAAIPILQRFSGVYLQDSSIVMLPETLSAVWRGCGGAKNMGQAAVKVEVRIELNRGGLTGPFLEDGRTNEHRSAIHAEPLEPGALRIADLGYFSLSEMHSQSQAGRFWLSYLLNTTAVFDPDGQRWEALDLLRAQNSVRIDLPVRLGVQAQLPARLLAVRVPQEIADRRRHRLHVRAQRLKQPVSQKALAWADWTVLITNLPVERLSLTEALILIRARWQVELLFKLWKSQGKMDEWRSAKPWRILCEVYAKLLAMLIQHWLFLLGCWQFPNRSLTKASQTVRHHATHLLCSFADLPKLTHAVHLLVACLAAGCRINKSQSNPRTFQNLLGLTQDGLA